VKREVVGEGKERNGKMVEDIKEGGGVNMCLDVFVDIGHPLKVKLAAALSGIWKPQEGCTCRAKTAGVCTFRVGMPISWRG